MNGSDVNNSNYTVSKQFKVVLLGEGAVGKSSLFLRYMQNEFNSDHLSTLQAAFATKVLVVDGQRIELNIWDTAGQEKFHSLGPIYYRDSQGAILVYDITDPSSFVRVQNWVTELHKMLGDSTVLFIVGNKIDLESSRSIATSDAEEYAKSVGAYFFECSAKENIGVNTIFEEITDVIYERQRMRSIEALTNPALRRQGSLRRSVRVVDDAAVERPSRKRCC